MITSLLEADSVRVETLPVPEPATSRETTSQIVNPLALTSAEEPGEAAKSDSVDELILAEVVETQAASATNDPDKVDRVAPATTEFSPANSPPQGVAQLRQSLLQRIQKSTALPRGLQGHLTNALQESPLVDQDGRLLAPVDLLMSAIEQWSPSAMRLDPRSLRRGEHPVGDSFFTGDSSDVSDEQAERIAREQLQRSGYLPRGRQ